MRTTTSILAMGTLLLGLAGPARLAAQDEAPPPVPWEKAVDAFFARLAAGEPGEAVDGLYAGSPTLASLGDQVSELKSRFVGLPDAVGEYLGHERVAVQPVSDRFVYAWHLAFYERQPLQFHFSFYKPKDRWVIYQFAYDQGVVEMAREMARRRVAAETEPR